ncbi:helix-hairpin-helix domain-containing protein [Patescibacteria group bacterium]|nr:helix-hairpin-helix domain-containing protein [Patescibacteria group bacterium]
MLVGVDGLVRSISSNLTLSGIIVGILLGSICVYVLSTVQRGKGYVVEQTGYGPSTTQEIIVDISGAVINPGLYHMPTDARVGDLIEKAGGIDREVSKVWVSRNLNVAKKLADAQKIYVPFEWEIVDEELADVGILAKPSSIDSVGGWDVVAEVNDPVLESADTGEGNSSAVLSMSQSGNSTGMISVNTCSAEELDSLPGIGPVYAQRIIDNRPYASIDQLFENSGVPKATLQKIEGSLAFSQ